MSTTSPQLTALRGQLERVPNPLLLPPPFKGDKAFDLRITPPGSKSLTNRALLLAALASGQSTLHNALTDADDAQRMLAALQQLGATITFDTNNPTTLHVRGVHGRWKSTSHSPLTLNLNNAGTATRFLAAAALLSPKGLVIDGNSRMRERPIVDLADLLTALGASCEWPDVATGHRHPGCPPLRITPPSNLTNLRDTVDVGATSSSQFISALLLTAPFLPQGLTLNFTGTPTSVSYIDMTIALMRRLGIRVTGEPNDPRGTGFASVRVEPLPHCTLPAFTYDVEPDASGATYFWAAAALVPRARVRIDGLAPGSSLQGDAEFVRLLERMGAGVEYSTSPQTFTSVIGPSTLRPIDADLSLMPDAAMTLAVLCCFTEGSSRLRGLKTLRVKETDRLAALQTELTKIGARIDIVPEANDESLIIAPPSSSHDQSRPVAFDTYDDHRMAMALALVGLRRNNVSINDPACVRKTYPTFWNHWSTLYT